jgi:hypothetical protein
MNYAERITALKIHFKCSSDTGLDRILGLRATHITKLKNRKIENPHKILFALSSAGISPDWFLTGDGPMLKPREPEGYGTKAQFTGADNGGISPRDYFAGQALSGLLADSDGFVVEDKASFDFIAKKSFEYADAMIARRGEA